MGTRFKSLFGGVIALVMVIMLGYATVGVIRRFSSPQIAQAHTMAEVAAETAKSLASIPSVYCSSDGVIHGKPVATDRIALCPVDAQAIQNKMLIQANLQMQINMLQTQMESVKRDLDSLAKEMLNKYGLPSDKYDISQLAPDQPYQFVKHVEGK